MKKLGYIHLILSIFTFVAWITFIWISDWQWLEYILSLLIGAMVGSLSASALRDIKND